MVDAAFYSDLLDKVVRPLLTEPEAFAATVARHKNAVRVEFKVADTDTGRVIGRGGATIRAIRSALEFAGEQHDERVAVELTNA